MGLEIKLVRIRNKALKGKFYGKVASKKVVHTETLAHNICHDTTLTEADVHAAVWALVNEMKNQLQEGNTVVLDGFGRFHLTIKSDMVDHADDFDISKHVKRVFCKFTPAASRDKNNRLERPFTDGVTLCMKEEYMPPRLLEKNNK